MTAPFDSSPFNTILDWFAQQSREVALICALDGTILDVSASCQQVLGCTPAELAHRSLFDLVQPEQVAAIRDTSAEPDTPAYWLEHEMRLPSGALVWLETTIARLPDDSGQPRLGVLMHNITPRKRLEARLHENQMRLRLVNTISFQLVSGAPLDELIWLALEQLSAHFPDVHVTYLTLDNPAAPLAQIVPGTGRVSATHGWLPEQWAALFQTVGSQTTLAIEDVRTDTRLGELGAALLAQQTIALLAAPLEDTNRLVGLLLLAAPQPRRWSAHEINLVAEITRYLTVAIWEHRLQAERQQAAEALRLTAERFHTALKNSPITVFNQDTDLRYRWIYNPALGNLVDEMIGKSDIDLFGDVEDTHLVQNIKRQVITSGIGAREEVRLWVNHQEQWFDLTVEPLRTDAGAIIGITCAAMDVTWRKEMERNTLQLALEHERVRVLTNFIRDASHEFRTPLTIIGSSLYLAERAESPERRRQQLDKAREQIDRIVHLLEDLTLMSWLDSDPPLERQPVNLNDIAQTVFAHMERRLQASALTVELRLDAALPSVPADAERLRTAVTRLLDNAVRYTRAGGQIVLETGVAAADVWLRVADTGTGIMDEVQPKIFERFFRLDDAHQTPGFGLGLPIAQKIAALHGGRITLESAPAAGSTFTLWLPIGQVAHSKSH